jgi:hypothetical protein
MLFMCRNQGFFKLLGTYSLFQRPGWNLDHCGAKWWCIDLLPVCILLHRTNRVTNRYSQREDEKDPEYENGLLAFPEGFQMLAGNPYLRNYTDTQAQQAISFTCLGTDNAETHEFPNYNCPGGLRAQVFFPSCWDGVNLDSADHK